MSGSVAVHTGTGSQLDSWSTAIAPGHSTASDADLRSRPWEFGRACGGRAGGGVLGPPGHRGRAADAPP